MNKSRLIPLSIIAVLGVALAWILFMWSPLISDSSEYHKLDLTTAPTGGDFTIQSKGKDVNLSDFRGKVIALYFGYTTCPDICPTSLSLLAQAMHQMNEKELENFQAIFISVDPERDTLSRLDEYAKYFHKSIIAGTAKQDEIDKITKLYGAAYKKVESNSAAGYLVDHSSYTYIIDKKGQLRYSLKHGTFADKILKAVRELLAE